MVEGAWQTKRAVQRVDPNNDRRRADNGGHWSLRCNQVGGDVGEKGADRRLPWRRGRER